jgi:serine/threonine protein kinase/tetratricopeptide (TPR) repeat protein
VTLAAGYRIAQYEILSPLGSGGMGEVYRARDARLGREVAIKVMAAHIAADPEMRRRFETEARAVASLSHSSILSIYEMVMTEGLPCAVMELLEGQNLRERMQQGPLPWRDAVNVAAAVADGLSVAHARGIVHRDLKPENIFLTSDGQVKILDFGLAVHRLDGPAESAGPTMAHTATGTVLGTFGYMSPEQIRGERVDGRTDIFALGCVLYEMLTGRRLFPGSTPQELIAQVLQGTTDVSAVDPLAPRELRVIVGRAVEREPERRFARAEDFAMALRALLSGSGVGTARGARSRGKSLAVLPFANTGADPHLDYLTDGITESIINSLSQIAGLRVVPRSLVFRYKGLQADPATVGLALNARTILTGRVTQHDDVLLIQAELVDTVSESQLWGEQFRQRADDVMAVQEEIAWRISEALRLKLSPRQRTKLRKRHTVNPEAYQEYLRGRYHWNNWRPDSFRRALEHFQRAIELDPSYALAYAGLGDAYSAMTYYGQIAPQDGFPRARAAAERAIALDPEIPDAHVSISLERLFWARDWPGAEREMKRAIELNPKLALAHSFYGLILVTSGRFEEALAEVRLASELDPLSLVINMGGAWVHHFSGNHRAAAEEARRTRELAPNFEEAGNILIASYELLGRYEEAAALLSEQPYFGVPLHGSQLLAAYREGGANAYWRKRLELLEAVEGTSPMVMFPLAIVHGMLGNAERSVDYLERMVDANIGAVVFIGVDPVLASLRGNSRYDALLTRAGVPMVSAARTAST